MRAFLDGDASLETVLARLRDLPDAELDSALDDLLSEIRTGRESRRRRARALLAALPEGRVAGLLCDRLRRDEDATGRNEARAALGSLIADGAAPALRLLSEVVRLDDDADVRLLAATTLGESGNPRAVPPLIAAIDDPDPNVAAAAAEAVGLLGDDRGITPLVRALERGHPWVRLAAAEALGELRQPEAVAPLSQAARDPEVALAAIPALGKIPDGEALGALTRLISDGVGRQREQGWTAVASLLATLGPGEIPMALREAAATDEDALLEAAARSPEHETILLGVVGSSEAIDRLLALAGGEGAADLAGAAIRILPPQASRDLLTRLHHLRSDQRGLVLGAMDSVPAGTPPGPLIECLADPDAETRASAAELLATMPEAETDPLLRSCLSDPQHRVGAALAFAYRRSPPQELLIELLEDDDPEVRRAAAHGLSSCGTRAAIPRLHERLDRETDPAVSREILLALASCGREEAVPIIGAYLSSRDESTRFFAIEALGQSAHPDAVPLLIEALRDDLASIRAAALRALGRIGDGSATESVAQQLGAADPDVRRVAGDSLIRLGAEPIFARVRSAARDPDREVRLLAVRLIARSGDPASVATLRQVAEEDADALVRRRARQALSASGAG